MFSFILIKQLYRSHIYSKYYFYLNIYFYFYLFIYFHFFIYFFIFFLYSGFGSIDFDLFSKYYSLLGPDASPYTLPKLENDEDTNFKDMMGNNNENKMNEKLINKLSSEKNVELLLLTKCYVSVIILFICLILLIQTIRKYFIENRLTQKRIGEYEILYTNSNLHENSELGCIHNKTEIIEESKSKESSVYGSMSSNISNPTTRNCLIQSDKKIIVNSRK